MTEEPVEIDLRLNQDVDTEGKKASEALDEVSEASEKSKALFLHNIKTQKKAVSDLAAEIVKMQKKAAEPSFKPDPKFNADLQEKVKLLQQFENRLESTEGDFAKFIQLQKAAAAQSGGIGKSSVTAAKGVNQLSYSVQQVARELPSLAISPQMFFLAISNNLPILQDQLRRTRIENELLKKSGQSTVPVWKQVAKSIFSWQSALIAGVTVLTVYGKEIFGAIGNIFEFGDAMKLTRKEIDGMTDSLSKNLGAELGQMDLVFSKLNTAKKGTNDYFSAKRDIIKQYGSYLQGMDAEITALDDVAGAYRVVRAEIIKTAKEKALKNVFEEQQTEFTNTYLTQLPKIRKLLVDQYGDIMGNQYADLIDEQLQQGKEFSYDVQRVIDTFTRTGTQIYTSTSGQTQSVEYEYNNLRDAINEVSDAQSSFEGKVADAKRSLNYVYKTESAEVNSLIQNQKDLIEQYKLMPEATEAQIKAKNKLIEAAKEEIKRLQELGTTNKTQQKKEETEKGNAKNDLAEIAVKTQEEIDASTIAAMQEGAAKRLREVELEYTKRKNAIAAKLKDIEELEKKSGAPATGQRELLAKLLETSAAEYEAAKKVIEAESKTEIDGVFADVNERFNSQLQNQLNRVNAYYDKQLKVVKANTTKTDQLQKSTAKLEEKRVNELAIVHEEYALEQLDWQEQIALQRQQYINEELRWESDKQEALLQLQISYATKKLQALNNIKASGGNVDEEISRLRTELERLNKELNRNNENKFKEKVRSFKDNLLSSGVDFLVNGLSQAVDLMHQIAEASGDMDLSESAEQLSALAQNFSAAGQGAQSGGWIGAIVGGGIDILGQLSTSFAQSKLEEEELKAFLANFANQLELFKLTINDADFESVFGTSQINKATKAYELAHEALQRYNEKLSETSEITADKNNGLNKGLALLTGGGILSGTGTSKQWEQQLQAYIAGYTKLQALSIKTKDRSGFANFFGKKDEYTSLFDLAPELWGGDVDGEFDISAAKAFLETNSQISDAQREQIQNIIDLKEAYDTAMEEVTGLLNDWLGSMANDMSDAIWDAVVNGGEDAWDTWAQIGSDAIAEVGKQMISELILNSYLNSFQERLQDAFGSDNAGIEIADIMAEIIDGFPAVYDTALESTKDFVDAMEERGIDFNAASTRTATSAGIAQASQDSVDELNGRITNIQQMIYDIRNYNAENIGFESERLNYRATMMNLVNQIADNTEFLKKLERIDTSLDNMNLRGVKIKQ